VGDSRIEESAVAENGLFACWSGEECWKGPERYVNDPEQGFEDEWMVWWIMGEGQRCWVIGIEHELAGTCDRSQGVAGARNLVMAATGKTPPHALRI